MGSVKSKFQRLFNTENDTSNRTNTEISEEGLHGCSLPWYNNKGALEVKHMIIANRNLTSIPEQIGYFRSLTLLDVSHNQIEYVPWSIIYLKQLEILNLSHNKIEKFPVTLFYLTKLTHLNLSYNLLETLPNELIKLDNLKHFDCKGNEHLIFCDQSVTDIFTTLSRRRNRHDDWKGWRPYYKGQYTCLKTLVEMCIDSIMDSQIDHLSASTIPPTVKKYLSSAEKFQQGNLPTLLKCSECRKYFSKQCFFDNHTCFVNQLRETD